MNFLTNPLNVRSTLRSTDIFVFGWIWGKHAYVYLTLLSHLMGLWSNVFIVGRTLLKVFTCKVTIYEKECLENQLVFISFAFDTFVVVVSVVVELLNQTQRVMHSYVVTSRSMNLIFKRLNFAI